jgi:hypothetical protein
MRCNAIAFMATTTDLEDCERQSQELKNFNHGRTTGSIVTTCVN